MPVPHDLPDMFGRFLANCRGETHHQAIIATSSQPGSKCKTQKVKAGLLVVLPVIAAFAVNNLRFLWMKSKPTGSETFSQYLFQVPGLLLTDTVTYYVICIPLELYARPVPLYPKIKCIMQE
jgi:hypothetical protein